MGKPTPSAPATPDPVATASAQGAANVQTAVANAYRANCRCSSPPSTCWWCCLGLENGFERVRPAFGRGRSPA